MTFRNDVMRRIRSQAVAQPLSECGPSSPFGIAWWETQQPRRAAAPGSCVGQPIPLLGKLSGRCASVGMTHED